jgi:hypothetical protein
VWLKCADDGIWTRVPHTETRKNVLSICVRKHLISVLKRKDYCVETGSSSVLFCGQEFVVTVGTHVLPHRHAGKHYRDFLLHGFPKLLEDVILAVWTRSFYVHDGAPAHFSLAVRDVLNDTCQDWWLTGEELTSWQSHSPDVSPTDFYMWGHLKLLSMRRELTMKRHFATTLWMLARLSATTTKPG